MTVALIIGVIVCVLVVLEVAASIAVRIRYQVAGMAQGARHPIQMDMYKDKSWAAKYWDEEVASYRFVWTPFVFWRRGLFEGETVNVGPDGNRATWQPENVPAGTEKKRVWIFGGSALWGSGAPDWETIPSQLNKILARDGVYAEVTNFGETGFVSTQELVLFLRALAENEKPDLVVFYNGFNDVLTSYQQRVPGLSANEHNRRVEFNLKQRRGDLSRELARNVMPYLTAVYERAETGFSRLFLGKERASNSYMPLNHGQYPLTEEERDALAKGTLDYYADNMEYAKTICDGKGIGFLVFWQPWVIHKNIRTGDEERIFASLDSTHPNAKEFTAVVEAMLAENPISSRPWFRNVSGAFRDDPTGYFYDQVHVDGEGNRVVAESMAKDVEAALARETR